MSAGSIIAIIIAAIVGIGFSIYGQKSKIVIKFKISWSDWVAPILFAFLLYMIVFAAEIIVSKVLICLLAYLEESYNLHIFFIYAITLLVRFLDNGALILFTGVLLSWLFGKMIKKANLDYVDYYSDKISKICFTVIIISVSIALIRITLPEALSDDGDALFFLNRVVMWVLSIFGSWIGFGYGCKGRIAEENDKRSEIVNASIKLSFKANFTIYSPLAFSLFLCIFISVISISDKLLDYTYCFCALAIVFCIAGVASLCIIKSIYNPSEEHSKKNFYKAWTKYKNGKNTSFYFGRNHCKFEKTELKIDAINIEYKDRDPAMDDDFKKLFDIESYTIQNDKDIDNILFELIKRCNNQDEFIRKGYDDCLKRFIENQRKKGITSIE